MWRAEARARLAEAAPAAAAEAEALAARADSAYAAAAAVMGGGLERADFDWAWAMVQSRAMRVREGSGPGARCLMPVADLLNHAPRCAAAGAGAAGRARPAGGPSASGAAEGDSFVFRAARALAPGEQVFPTRIPCVASSADPSRYRQTRRSRAPSPLPSLPHSAGARPPSPSPPSRTRPVGARGRAGAVGARGGVDAGARRSLPGVVVIRPALERGAAAGVRLRAAPAASCRLPCRLRAAGVGVYPRARRALRRVPGAAGRRSQPPAASLPPRGAPGVRAPPRCGRCASQRKPAKLLLGDMGRLNALRLSPAGSRRPRRHDALLGLPGRRAGAPP